MISNMSETLTQMLEDIVKPLRPDWESGLKGFLGRARGRDFSNKSFDGELVDVVYNKIAKVRPDIAEGITFVMKQDKSNALVTKQFRKKKLLFDALDKFLLPDVPNRRWKREFKFAFRRVLKQLRKSNVSTLQPMYLYEGMEIVGNLSKTDTSCGFIDFDHHKEDIPDDIVKIAMHLFDTLPEETFPAIALTRCQISGFIDEKTGAFHPEKTKQKYRLVWCIDAATVLVESIYARPFQNEVMQKMLWYAGGMDDVSIRRRVRQMDGNHWVSIDFSGYDSTIPSWLIEMAFDLVKEFYPKEDHRVIGWIAHQFIHTTILMPDGKLYTKHHGIPSGSYFTQIIGSLCNILISYAFMYHYFDGDEEKVSQVFEDEHGVPTISIMGDDNLLRTRNEVSIEAFSEFVKEVLGMTIHPDKCESGYGADCSYLKRVWKEDGAWREPFELVINMICSERKRDYKGKGFSPWHVIYGYYLAYPVTMRKFFSKGEIIYEMEKHGGVAKLLKVHPNDLPGSLRNLVINYPNRWRMIVKTAESFLEAV